MESRSGSGGNRAKARSGQHLETKRSVNNLDVGRGKAAERGSLLAAMELLAAGHRVDREGKSALQWVGHPVLSPISLWINTRTAVYLLITAQ